MARFTAFLTVVALALAAGAGCSSAAQRYRDASALCVAEHDTRESIDACRAEVRARFGVAGAAPSATRAADASAPGAPR